MNVLTRAEEPIMHLIWKNKKVFVKDIIQQLPDPKPPYNTVSSIVRILESKGMIGHEVYGRIHQYYPLITKREYRIEIFKSFVKNYFEGSFSTLVSQLTEEDELSEKEIDEIKELIEKHKYHGK